jgi:hypothetical protein
MLDRRAHGIGIQDTSAATHPLAGLLFADPSRPVLPAALRFEKMPAKDTSVRSRDE